MQSPTCNTIPEIIQESNADNQFNGILPAEYAAKIVCVLSQQVDRLFEDAALKMNLRALCYFLNALCKASKDQLFISTDASKEQRKLWWKRNKPRKDESNVLLLARLGEVMLKCVKSGRPLIHIMRVSFEQLKKKIKQLLMSYISCHFNIIISSIIRSGAFSGLTSWKQRATRIEVFQKKQCNAFTTQWQRC